MDNLELGWPMVLTSDRLTFATSTSPKHVRTVRLVNIHVSTVFKIIANIRTLGTWEWQDVVCLYCRLCSLSEADSTVRDKRKTWKRIFCRRVSCTCTIGDKTLAWRSWNWIVSRQSLCTFLFNGTGSKKKLAVSIDRFCQSRPVERARIE